MNKIKNVSRKISKKRNGGKKLNVILAIALSVVVINALTISSYAAPASNAIAPQPEIVVYHSHSEQCGGTIWRFTGEFTPWGQRYNYGCDKCGWWRCDGGNNYGHWPGYPTSGWYKYDICSRTITSCKNSEISVGKIYIEKNCNQLEVKKEGEHLSILAVEWNGVTTGTNAKCAATEAGIAFCKVTVLDDLDNYSTDQTLELSIELTEYDFYEVTITKSAEGWTNKNVVLTCNTSDDTKTYEWYKDGEKISGEGNEITVSEYGSYTCKGTSVKNFVKESKPIIVKIDKTPARIYKIDYAGKMFTKHLLVTVNAEDE